MNSHKIYGFLGLKRIEINEASAGDIIAIAGSRVSEKYKLTKESERALVIEYGTIEKQQSFD